MAQEKEIKRRFSLEEDFMNYSTDDLLYGFMRSLSTAKQGMDGIQKQMEYLTIKTFTEAKKTIALSLGCTTRTITNRVNKLKEAGLIAETTIKVGAYEYPSYIFPYDSKGKFKLVNKEMLRYLIDTRSANAIRVYLYLLSKFEWKENYVFTIKEIKLALGFAESTTTADKSISNVLFSLSREGLIQYKKVYQNEVNYLGKIVPVERMLLEKVVTDPNDLNKNKNFEEI